MKNRLKKRAGQNVAEYAILIALVVGAVIAMQKFTQRGLQGRMRDATKFLVTKTNFPGGAYQTAQYEPYYQKSEYNVDKKSYEDIEGDSTKDKFASNTETIRKKDGFTNTQMGAQTGGMGQGMEFDN